MYFGPPRFLSLASSSTPQECQWTLNAPSGSNYQIQITYFDLPESSGCSYDSLKVYDGPTDSDYLLANLCGDLYCNQQTQSIDIPISGRSALVKLRTTSPGDFRGFRAIVEEI